MRKIPYIINILLFLMLFSSCEFFFGSSDDDDYKNYTLDGSDYSDTDLDGIPDEAEVKGTTFYKLPLYDWGARTGQRDIFIHVATMDYNFSSSDYQNADAGLILQKEALDKVVAAFAAEGIAVHFDVGSTGLYDELTAVDSDAYNLSDRDNQIPYSQTIDLVNGDYLVTDYWDDSTYFPDARKNIFYYLAFGSYQTSNPGSSGISFCPGRVFLITLANWNLRFGSGWYRTLSDGSTYTFTSSQMKNLAVNYQAATIMHEFGHNLSLRHGGDQDLNYKPNYYSIMNYLYQLNGLPTIGTNEGDRYYYEQYYLDWYDYYYDSSNWSGGSISWDGFTSDWSQYLDYEKADITMNKIDFENSPYSSTFVMNYSYGNGSSLNENNLDESVGLGQSGSNALDWNGNGATFDTGLSYNINRSYDTTYSSSLYDYDDWTNLYLYYYVNNIMSGVSRSVLDENQSIETEEPPAFMLEFER